MSDGAGTGGVGAGVRTATVAETPGDVGDDWEQLVAGALLGTDRRRPVLPGWLVDHSLAAAACGPDTDRPDADRPGAVPHAPDAAEQTLMAAAALGTARVAGRRPVAADRPAPPTGPSLGYRLCSPGALGLLQQALAGVDRAWPVVVGQWVAAAVAAGQGPHPLFMVQLADHPSFAPLVAQAGPFLTWWSSIDLAGLAPLPRVLHRRPAEPAPELLDAPWSKERTRTVAKELLRSRAPTTPPTPQAGGRADEVRRLTLWGDPGMLQPFANLLTVHFPLAAAVIGARDRLLEEFPPAHNDQPTTDDRE